MDVNFEEDPLHISFQVKTEKLNEFAQEDDQQYEDTIDQENKVEHPINDVQHPHKCTHCQKSFSENSNLRRHIRIHTGERPYKCNHCQMSFARSEVLLNHIRTHTGERPYKCTHCQKAFSQMTSLKRHLQIHKKELS